MHVTTTSVYIQLQAQNLSLSKSVNTFSLHPEPNHNPNLNPNTTPNPNHNSPVAVACLKILRWKGLRWNVARYSHKYNCSHLWSTKKLYYGWQQVFSDRAKINVGRALYFPYLLILNEKACTLLSEKWTISEINHFRRNLQFSKNPAVAKTLQSAHYKIVDMS